LENLKENTIKKRSNFLNLLPFNSWHKKCLNICHMKKMGLKRHKSLFREIDKEGDGSI